MAFSLLTIAPAFAEGDRCELQPLKVKNSSGIEEVVKDAQGKPVQVMKASSGPSGCEQEFKDKKPLFFKTADCYCCGTCTINDIVGTVIQVSRFIFGIAGSLALLMILYGGFQWLTAAGSSERVKKGTETLTHAAVGLAIIFGAWILVNFILIAITGQRVDNTGVANLMNGNWFHVE